MPKGAGSIITFGVKGGRDAGKAFIENVKLASHLANVGDAKTLIIHPATTTHSRIDAEALIAAGITEDMVRISVGIEDVSDIQDDFNKGIDWLIDKTFFQDHIRNSAKKKFSYDVIINQYKKHFQFKD